MMSPKFWRRCVMNFAHRSRDGSHPENRQQGRRVSDASLPIIKTHIYYLWKSLALIELLENILKMSLFPGQRKIKAQIELKKQSTIPPTFFMGQAKRLWVVDYTCKTEILPLTINPFTPIKSSQNFFLIEETISKAVN